MIEVDESICLEEVVYKGSTKLTLTLPGGSRIFGEIEGEGGYVNRIDVPKSIQGNGVGSRLYKAFTAEIKRRGGNTLTGIIISHGGYKLSRRIFGEALELSSISKEGTSWYSLEEGEKYSTDPMTTLIFHINLQNVDTTHWELPVTK